MAGSSRANYRSFLVFARQSVIFGKKPAHRAYWSQRGKTNMTTGKKNHIREPLWYKDAVIYELHIKAFRDSNNDGIGDFAGLFEKLEYIESLGVTTIWLLPYYPSPQRDDGYDIADYYDVNPAYGTLKDLRKFLNEAHKRNLNVLTELVMNHTSDQHAWFQRARRSPKGSAHRDYYIWTDDPNQYKDARIIFPDYESSNWTWDPVAGQYYWHRFFHHQPDLNYRNPLVQKEILRIIDFWLNFGIDGFRLDAIPYLYEAEGTTCDNLPETHDFLRKLRRHIDKRHPNVMLLAEANMWPEDSADYFGNGDECHMNFHFPLMPRMFMAVNMENRYPITDIIEQTPAIPENCQWATFLRNHDELTLEMVTEEERDYMYKVFTKDPLARINLGIRKRLAPLLDNDRRKIELMNVLLFSLPGTPVIYYGDEIGMGDNHFLGDRNGVRTPMQWNPGRNAGFSDANPQKLYLPLVIDPEYTYENVNVENQQRNSNSLLWWMRRLIKMRKRFKAFGRGDIRFLDSDNTKVLIFVRSYGGEKILVVANLSRYAQSARVEMSELTDHVPVEVFSQNEFPKIETEPYTFTFAPYGYYWFLLTRQVEKSPLPNPGLPDEDLQIENWEELHEPGKQELLETLLRPYLHQRLWFNTKDRKVEHIRMFDLLPISSKKNDFNGAVLIFETTFFEGLYEKYRFILAFASGREEASLRRKYPESIVCPLFFKGRSGSLVDASYTEQYHKTLLQLFRKNLEVDNARSSIGFDITAELKEMLEDRNLAEECRLIDAGNRHVVIQYGKKFIIKLYRKIDRGTDRDVELCRYLSIDKRFSQVPRYLGSIIYHKKDDIRRTLGIVQEFVPNYGSAWQYMSDALNMYYERMSARGGKFSLPTLQGSITAPMRFLQFDKDTQQILGGAYIEHIRLLAIRTAQMHQALGVETLHPDFAPEEISLHYQRSIVASMKGQIRSTFKMLDRFAGSFPVHRAREIRKLIDRQTELSSKIQRIYHHNIQADRIRPHGDYSLHAVLFLKGDFVITNFEGDYTFSLTERRLRKSAVIDVASMLDSFHDVAYSALFQNEPSGALAEFWYHHIAQIFLINYLDHVKDESFTPRGRDFTLLLENLLLEKYLSNLETELRKDDKTRAIISVRGINKILDLPS